MPLHASRLLLHRSLRSLLPQSPRGGGSTPADGDRGGLAAGDEGRHRHPRRPDHRGGDQQRGAASSISRWSRERVGVFGAFAAGRVCHRSQEPRDRRGRHHAPHPAQERPDHAPLRPNLRAVDPQCHHRREPLIAAEPAPVPPLSTYLAKRCPRRVQLDLVEPAVPLEPTADCDVHLLRTTRPKASLQTVFESEVRIPSRDAPPGHASC